MNKQVCLHFVVAGKVQGVWFRAATQRQAQALSITGWICNLPDGSVEGIACGALENVAKLHEWLKHGPEHAEVKDLFTEELPWQDHASFTVM